MYSCRRFTFVAALRSFVFVLGAAMAVPADAADWYVAPLTQPPTSAAPKGTKDDPFATVALALQSGKIVGGDRILMMPGPHGALSIRNTPAFDKQITIMSETERTAQVDSVELRVASNIRLLSLSVWPTDPLNTPPSWLVQAADTTSDIVVEDLVVRGEQGEEKKFASWDKATWLQRPFNGIFLMGRRSSAVENNLAGIAFGIALAGNDSRAINNVVNFYSGDGLRGLGNNNIFRGNRVVNCITVNDNHADGFQSWAGPSGSVAGLVLDSNVIIEWTHPRKDHPLRCKLQGIGLFDGFYDDLTITNNLVTTTQFHGISVYGARKAIVANNTVANTDGLTGGDPFLAVVDHKNGTLSSNVLVVNNVAMRFVDQNVSGDTVVFRNNSVIGTPGAVFENPFAFDYRPKSSSGFIDTADVGSAPSVDILGNPRPVGNGPDRGAYELMESGAPAQPTAPAVTPGPTTETPTEPVVTLPVIEEPVETDPVVTEPVLINPIVTGPVVTEPAVVAPVVTDPVVKKPVAPKGKRKPVGRLAINPVGRLAINSVGSLIEKIMGRLAGISF